MTYLQVQAQNFLGLRKIPKYLSQIASNLDEIQDQVPPKHKSRKCLHCIILLIWREKKRTFYCIKRAKL
jgi:hypothetical protein